MQRWEKRLNSETQGWAEMIHRLGGALDVTLNENNPLLI